MTLVVVFLPSTSPPIVAVQVAAVVPASSHPSIAVADTTLPIVEVVTALEKWYVAVPIVTVAGTALGPQVELPTISPPDVHRSAKIV